MICDPRNALQCLHYFVVLPIISNFFSSFFFQLSTFLNYLTEFLYLRFLQLLRNSEEVRLQPTFLTGNKFVPRIAKYFFFSEYWFSPYSPWTFFLYLFFAIVGYLQFRTHNVFSQLYLQHVATWTWWKPAWKMILS